MQRSWSFCVCSLLVDLMKMSSIANKVAARWLQHPSFPAGHGQNAFSISELARIMTFTVYVGPVFEYEHLAFYVKEAILSFAI